MKRTVVLRGRDKFGEYYAPTCSVMRVHGRSKGDTKAITEVTGRVRGQQQGEVTEERRRKGETQGQNCRITALCYWLIRAHP
jgi:hypothetical protein